MSQVKKPSIDYVQDIFKSAQNDNDIVNIKNAKSALEAIEQAQKEHNKIPLDNTNKNIIVTKADIVAAKQEEMGIYMQDPLPKDIDMER